MNVIVRLFINAAALWVATRVVTGISYSGDWPLLFVVALVFGVLNVVVRPILIQRGAKLPLTLIFVGVIGGLIAFGMVGIFVGPVVLAVTYELLVSWVRLAPAEASPEGERPHG